MISRTRRFVQLNFPTQSPPLRAYLNDSACKVERPGLRRHDRYKKAELFLLQQHEIIGTGEGVDFVIAVMRLDREPFDTDFALFRGTTGDWLSAPKPRMKAMHGLEIAVNLDMELCVDTQFIIGIEETHRMGTRDLQQYMKNPTDFNASHYIAGMNYQVLDF